MVQYYYEFYKEAKQMVKNIFSLEGKKALVIGGGGGIGQAIAQGLSEAGASVAIASRNREKLEQVASAMKEKTGNEFYVYGCDVTDEAAVEKLAADFISDFGCIDILVNSQGYNKKYPACEFPMDEWDQMYNVNIRSIMLSCKYFGRHMIERKYGRIINVSSIGAVRNKPMDESAAYSSTKGAVATLTMVLATGWGEHGITVNAIAPIMTETDMMKSIFEKMPELRDGTAARVPVGRICLPEDAIPVAVFFASDATEFINGQTIYLDGAMRWIQ